MRNTDVVVGVDGSASSWDALHWAVAEACRWQADLRVVIVDAAGEPSTGLPADERLARMVTEARRADPAVRVTGYAVRGSVGAALRAASARSRLLVVGDRGTGGFGRLTLGSTGQQVAAHATVPVVVVRGRHGSEESPIVIGVDGSAGSEAALAAGLDEARVRGCTVIAVFAYGRAGHPWLRLDAPTDPGVLHGPAYTALEALVGPWRDKFPRMSIGTTVTAEPPVSVLVALSGHAQLLVIGAYGHDDPHGPLGSVPIKLLHHAHCPVMVVR